jgi:hypothetical protein
MNMKSEYKFRNCAAVAVAAFAVGLLAGRAETPPGLGRNMAGVLRWELTGSNVMVSAPFLRFGSTTGTIQRTLTEILGDQLTGSDHVIEGSDRVAAWDSGDFKMQRYWKANNNGQPEWRRMDAPFAHATNVFAPGVGFWVMNNQGYTQTFYIAGEVPSQQSVPAGGLELGIATSVAFVAYGFPASLGINDATFKTQAITGLSAGSSDGIWAWGPASNGYTRYWAPHSSIYPPGGWWRVGEGPFATMDRLPAGQGFYYFRKGPGFTWREPKPYSWP